MIDFNTGMPAWPFTVDQDGNILTEAAVHNDRVKVNAAWRAGKLAEFEKALAGRCYDINEVYNKMPYDNRFGSELYQVGMLIYAPVITSEGIEGRLVGQIM